MNLPGVLLQSHLRGRFGLRHISLAVWVLNCLTIYVLICVTIHVLIYGTIYALILDVIRIIIFL